MTWQFTYAGNAIARHIVAVIDVKVFCKKIRSMTLLFNKSKLSYLFTVCISSSILKISPLVGEECRDQFLLGIAEEFAEFAAEGFRVGSFESMFASDILLDSF